MLVAAQFGSCQRNLNNQYSKLHDMVKYYIVFIYYQDVIYTFITTNIYIFDF